ncbi:hypothetical protein NT03LS_1214, partial [Listeria seeligeri FSL N1-067]
MKDYFPNIKRLFRRTKDIFVKNKKVLKPNIIYFYVCNVRLKETI